MTTAHRPTLESKRGKEITITNTIQHGRSQPAHKQLKLRQTPLRSKGTRVSPEEARAKVDQLKWELITKEKEHYLREGKTWLEDRFAQKASPLALEALPAGTSYTAHRERVQEQFGATDGEVVKVVFKMESDSEDDSERGAESESESESDEEEAVALLRELEKIKTERQQAKAQAAQAAQKAQAMGSNPLLSGTTTASSWRLATVFNTKQERKRDSSDRFVNDMLRSDFHRKFMDRYAK